MNSDLAPRHDQHAGEQGFTLVESLIALLLLSGGFLMLAQSVPLSALLHRAALERETAMSLAQFQLEYFLTNPGPYPGDAGTTRDFANASRFPQGYVGAYRAYSFAAGSGLTVIVVTVKPPHAPKVELSAIDTVYSNVTP